MKHFSKILDVAVAAIAAGRRVRPLTGALIIFLVGLLFVGSSALIGIAIYSYTVGEIVGKQVGFLPALNWSVSFLLGFPVLAFLILSCLDEVDSILDHLISRKMVVNPNFEHVSRSALGDIAAGYERKSIAGCLLVTAAVFVFLMVEWYFVAGEPLLSGSVKMGADWFFELDWSVAALLSSAEAGTSSPNRWLNFVFGFFAYLYLAAGVSALLCFFVFVGGFAMMLRELSAPTSSVRLIPDMRETDARRGFAVFEDFFVYSMYAMFVGLVLLYCMRLQNLYLRDRAIHIDVYIFADIKAGFQTMLSQGAGTLNEGLAELSDAVFHTGLLQDWQGFLAIFVVGFVFAVTMSILGGTLRQTAKHSREFLRNALINDRDRVVRGLELPEGSESRSFEAAAMELWPLAWPKPQQLIAYMVFGFLCLIFFKLGLLWLGLRVARLFVRMV